MKHTTFSLFIALATAFACAVEAAEELELRKGDLEDAEIACGDDDQVEPGDVNEYFTVISTDVIELHDGVDLVLDEKTGVSYLDNGLMGIQCRCNTGCNEILPCSDGTNDAGQKTCSGDCSGTDSDGKSCGRCTWHVVQTPSPASTPGGLDPNEDPFDRPPGIDPTAGELDPTFGDGELPPFDPPPGELDPTW